MPQLQNAQVSLNHLSPSWITTSTPSVSTPLPSMSRIIRLWVLSENRKRDSNTAKEAGFGLARSHATPRPSRMRLPGHVPHGQLHHVLRVAGGDLHGARLEAAVHLAVGAAPVLARL